MGLESMSAKIPRDQLWSIVLSNMGTLNCIQGDITFGSPVLCGG
jgi:hypothetical protein